jgi:hypothetical protein
MQLASSLWKCILKMVAVCYSESLVSTYQTAQCNAPEDHSMILRKQEKYIIVCIPVQQNKTAYAIIV